jgi:F420H(2)-dependent quinone reductase
VAVELTPSGKRGGRMPRLPGPVGAVADALAAAAYGRFGERMRVAGLPLLLLTTYGARSGARRRSLLGWMPDGNGWLVFAAAGGAARHRAGTTTSRGTRTACRSTSESDT